MVVPAVVRCTALTELGMAMKLTGNGVIRLMRNHKVRIRDLAKKYGITLKRVREVRANGVQGFLAAEWIYLITGVWPAEGNGEKNGHGA